LNFIFGFGFYKHGFEPVDEENNIQVLSNYFDLPLIKRGGLQTKVIDKMKHRYK
jgi:hypothetical protein